MIRTTASLAAVLSLAAGLAWADNHEAAGADDAAAGMEGMDHEGMEGMDHGDMAMGDASGAMQGYMAAMMTIMDGMEGMTSTGDPDADFLTMMIPHHQSAVDMARIVIETGDDPEVRAMAEQIIESQEAEITRMQEMLAAMNGGATAAPAAGGDDAAGSDDAADDAAEGETASE